MSLLFIERFKSMVWHGPRFFRGGHKTDFPEGGYPPIMSIISMECIKPDLKQITEHDSPMVVMGLLLCNSWFGAMESATDF